MTNSPTPPENTGSRAGFTLIELLVVVAIIGILISVTIPISKMVHDGGNSSRSLANLKSIGTGLSTYVNDNNYLLPIIESDEELDWTTVNVDLEPEELELLPFWARALIHHAADNGADFSRNVLNCPGLRWKAESGQKLATDDILLAYGATDAMAGYDEERELTQLIARSYTTIENKPNTILLVETKQEGGLPTSYPYIPWDEAKRDFERGKHSDTNKVDFRFKKGVNCLMSDWSARGYRFKDKSNLEQPHWNGDDYESLH